MEYFIKESKNEEKIYRAKEMEIKKLNVFGSELAIKIVRELAKQPACAMDLARILNEHEQKIYYHLRKLEKAGMISLERTEVRAGALTKIYKIEYPYLAVKLFEGEPLKHFVRPKETEILHPFIKNGRMNSIIVVSSPDPHGRFGAASSDGYAAIDLALYLGSFLKKVEINYKLDTQIDEEDLKNNLILVGGPKANMVVDKLNKFLPIYFDEKNDWQIVSTLTKTVYRDEDVGLIIKMKNPFNPKNYVFLFCGRRFKGTRAATLALIKHSKELEEENKFKDGIARVVRGVDKDSDSIIDDCFFLE
ncbi:MAG: helix-turn-helix domain-containing protein [Candidatus Aenigmarchaeota archaeon]|nr:helix-turn-helix domain-containing protein [Candidatus Aenigmarchaeota archaeon]